MAIQTKLILLLLHLQPILRYFYHQIYHVHNKNDCIGENSVSRCILTKESHEIRHVRNLQKAIIDLNLDGRYGFANGKELN